MNVEREERIRGLEADVDARLTELWLELWDVMGDNVGPAGRELVGRAVRSAYALGYQDALREDAEGRRGELARAHGYTHH